MYAVGRSGRKEQHKEKITSMIRASQGSTTSPSGTAGLQGVTLPAWQFRDCEPIRHNPDLDWFVSKYFNLWSSRTPIYTLGTPPNKLDNLQDKSYSRLVCFAYSWNYTHQFTSIWCFPTESLCDLLFHWILDDCKLPLRGRWLRAQVCGVANIFRVETCCIGNRHY
jgi:hypothetical protein